MKDKNIEYVMQKMDEAWKHLAAILDDEKLEGGDCFDIMITINARYLNACRKFPDIQKKIIKDEYLTLLDEKLG